MVKAPKILSDQVQDRVRNNLHEAARKIFGNKNVLDVSLSLGFPSSASIELRLGVMFSVVELLEVMRYTRSPDVHVCTTSVIEHADDPTEWPSISVIVGDIDKLIEAGPTEPGESAGS